MTTRSQFPTPAGLRLFSRDALTEMLRRMPGEPSDGDPYESAQAICGDLLQGKHRDVFDWLRRHAPIESICGKEVNAAFAEIELCRVIADVAADFLGQTASSMKRRMAELRARQRALSIVIDLPRWSPRTRRELQRELGALHWLNHVGQKGAQREQYLMYTLFSHSAIAFQHESKAPEWTPLLVALTGKDQETVAREVRRWFSEARKRDGRTDNQSK